MAKAKRDRLHEWSFDQNSRIMTDTWSDGTMLELDLNKLADNVVDYGLFLGFKTGGNNVILDQPTTATKMKAVEDWIARLYEGVVSKPRAAAIEAETIANGMLELGLTKLKKVQVINRIEEMRASELATEKSKLRKIMSDPRLNNWLVEQGKKDAPAELLL